MMKTSGRKCSDDPKKTAKQAARKRMIMIGATVAVFLIIAGGVAGLYFHGKIRQKRKVRP